MGGSRRVGGRGAAAVAGAVAAAALLLGGAQAARAESGRFNLHLQVGVGLPPIVKPNSFGAGGGFAGALKFDYKIHPIVSAQIGVLGAVHGDYNRDNWIFGAVLGTKLRFLDDHVGPLFYVTGSKGKRKGNVWGVLWVDVNVGWGMYGGLDVAGHLLAFDVAAGYEVSLFEYLGLGPYVGFDFFYNFGGDRSIFIASLGVSFTAGYPPDVSGLPDGDGDGLPDVDEDKNGNSVVDEGETDPAKADSDEDGLDDGDEVRRGTKPLDPDSDGDGAFDGEEVDASSDPLDATKSPAFVDEVEKDKPPEDPLLKGVVLTGVTFKGEALAPTSKAALDDWAAKIKARTDLTLLEIGVHVHLDAADLSADVEKLRIVTKVRADKVVAELVKRGVPATMLASKGYGGDEPIDASNPAINERVTLKKLK